MPVIRLSGLLVLLVILARCKTDTPGRFIYNCDDGVCIEVVRSPNDTIISYTDDNVIYQEGVEHLFNYYYQDSTGEKYLIGQEGHSLTPPDSINSQTITKLGYLISRKMEKNLTFPGEKPYSQSGLEYRYLNTAGESLYPIGGSGLVENEKNIWVHPFRRSVYFAMLNINPYPYVKFPLEKGKSWEWQLAVGGPMYTNPIWAVWEGSTTRYHSYTVEGKVIYELAGIGPREVWDIRATSTGEIGPSSAIFYFDPAYGFVMMEWHNLNKSIFRFDVAEINLLVSK